ncbi:MAG: hypothetical protein ABWY13_04400 [Mesorhizobium sp.]|jgi:Mg2+ and Co2+ transporter CorA
MQLQAIVASAVLLSVLPLSAGAQEADRYTLEQSADGYVRMDRRTGEMSICEERSGQLVCRLAADERSAFQDEVDRLADRVSNLEKRIAELEASGRPNTQSVLPTEEDIEKSLGYMERFFRRFMDIVKDFDKDWRQGEPQTEQQKT